MRRCRHGLTLIEVLLAVALLAMGILFVVSIIPTSVLSLKKAENMQAAAAYGMELIECARLAPPQAGETREFEVTINQTSIKFVREVAPLADDLFDVVVTATVDAEEPPLRMATRVNAVLGEE